MSKKEKWPDLIERLEININVSSSIGEPADWTSWDEMTGILISREEAKLFLKMLKDGA